MPGRHPRQRLTAGRFPAPREQYPVNEAPPGAGTPALGTEGKPSTASRVPSAPGPRTSSGSPPATRDEAEQALDACRYYRFAKAVNRTSQEESVSSLFD